MQLWTKKKRILSPGYVSFGGWSPGVFVYDLRLMIRRCDFVVMALPMFPLVGLGCVRNDGVELATIGISLWNDHN